MIGNHQIAKILNEIAAYLDVDNVAFKPRAYEKAAEARGWAAKSDAVNTMPLKELLAFFRKKKASRF